MLLCGEQAARQEVERQRREEWERGKKEELSRRRTGEQEEISRLKARKKSLELELEAVVGLRWSRMGFSFREWPH